MFQTIRNAWKLADLRRKILFVLFILLLYRIGAQIPVPFMNGAVAASIAQQTEGSILQYLNILSGGAFSQATLFALGISPYITSSIVIQLLSVAIPALERLAKEGEEGKQQDADQNDSFHSDTSFSGIVSEYILLYRRFSSIARDLQNNLAKNPFLEGKSVIQ